MSETNEPMNEESAYVTENVEYERTTSEIRNAPDVEYNAVESTSSENYGKRDIHIRHLDNGYVVEVGCHSFAFETVESMMKKITQYLKDPSGVEQKWWDKKLF